MISNVAIENYKSIRTVEFEAKRVNVFIGEPNCGKSNILEALSLLARETRDNFHNSLRIRKTAELFYDRNLSSPIRVRLDTNDDHDGIDWMLGFENNCFKGTVASKRGTYGYVEIGTEGVVQDYAAPPINARFYQFAPETRMDDPSVDYLTPPFGRNLPALLSSNKALRREIVDVFNALGFKLIVKPTESELEIAREVDGEFFAYSYRAVSETLRRIVFFKAALASNENSILLLDEPEAQTFPVFTKELAESISSSETNQFFITTHNPYLLASLIQKTSVDELAVHVVHMENFQTRVKRMSQGKLEEIQELGSSVFFNLERLLMD